MNHSRIILWAIQIICLTAAIQASEGPNEDRLIAGVQAYLANHSTPVEEQKWQKEWDNRVAQAISDNPAMDEQKYFNQAVLTYAAGKNFDQLNTKDRVLFCRYYLLQKNRKLELCSQIKEQLTQENIDKAIEVLHPK